MQCHEGISPPAPRGREGTTSLSVLRECDRYKRKRALTPDTVATPVAGRAFWEPMLSWRLGWKGFLRDRDLGESGLEMETGRNRTAVQPGLRSGASPGSHQSDSAGPLDHTPAPRSHRVWADLGPESPRPRPAPKELAVEASPQTTLPGAGR